MRMGAPLQLLHVGREPWFAGEFALLPVFKIQINSGCGGEPAAGTRDQPARSPAKLGQPADSFKGNGLMFLLV